MKSVSMVGVDGVHEEFAIAFEGAPQIILQKEEPTLWRTFLNMVSNILTR